MVSAAPAGVTTSRMSSLLILTAGVLALVIELLRAPAESLAAAAIFGVVWLVRERLLRKPHHHQGFHRARREILTTTVISGVVIALSALALTALELSGETQALGQLGVPGDDQLPWTAGLLMNGVFTLVALAWVLVGARALQRRSRHHQARTV